MKKVFSMFTVLLAMSAVSMGAATHAKSYDLIVAPARYSVMQVMFDVIAKRPSVLVSYQGEAKTGEPLLHVWNGAMWNPISLHDLNELSFVEKTPTRAILIGDDALLPASIRDGLAWMPEVVYIRDLNNASLLNEMGRLMKWSSREWKWYSTRYNLTLEDEAAALRNSSWYDQPGPKKEGSSEYKPVPVSTSHDTLTPPSTLPLKSEVEKPSDVPAADSTAVGKSNDNLDEIVESIETEETKPVDVKAADEAPAN